MPDQSTPQPKPVMELRLNVTMGEQGMDFFKKNPDLILHSINVTKQTVSFANKTTNQPVPAVNFFEKIVVNSPKIGGTNGQN